MPNSNDKKRKSLSYVLQSGMSLPSDALLGEVRIEMRGRNVLFVNGCRRIIKYTPEHIIFSVNGFRIDIMGKCLTCTTYHYGSVTVEGHICSLTYEEDE